MAFKRERPGRPTERLGERDGEDRAGTQMIRLIYFLVVATAVALIAAWFAEHPGNVQLDWQGRHIETSVGMALLLVLAAALLLSLLISLVRLLVSAPARWRQTRRQARELRGYRALSNGMIAAAAGDPRAAKIHATEARRLIAQEPAVLLLSTQTAQLVGDEDAALLSYRAMLKHTETSLLATRGLLGQSVKLGDSEEALELARRAYRQNPDAPWTAAALFDLLTKDQLWPDALAVVPAMERVGAIDAEKGRHHRAVLHTLIGREQLAAKAQGEALQSAQRAIEAAPGLPPAAVLLAAAYSVLGRPTHARRALERAWSVAPHPELARAYAELVPTESAPDRLRRFDRLRQLRPGRYRDPPHAGRAGACGVQPRDGSGPASAAAGRADCAHLPVDGRGRSGKRRRCGRRERLAGASRGSQTGHRLGVRGHRRDPTGMAALHEQRPLR